MAAARPHAAATSTPPMLPHITFPPELPITAHVDAIAKALRYHQVVIVCGDTGSGKTTQLPKIALKAAGAAAA